jgi:excinuclease ABC subunit C
MKVDFVPREIIFPVMPENRETLTEWLSSRSERRVYFKEPKIGEKKKLQRLAGKNAKLLLSELKLQKKKRSDYIPKTVSTLQEDLQMDAPPRRVEAFDISHIGGTETVASMVSFIDGQPRKNEYRRFKVKTVEGVDDFASMREVIQRRYSRVLEEKLPLPDLILIDGGKGQLSAAVGVLNEMDFPPVTVIGLAKRLEEVFIPQQSDPLFIAKSSPGLVLLQRIRDEAHRFAVTYHRKLRGKSMVVSGLDHIEGVGKIRKERLMAHFKTLKRIKEASIEAIAEVEGISENMAIKIKQQLTGEEIVHQ